MGVAMALKQLKIVDSSLAKSSTKNLPVGLVDNYLRLQGVPLFLPTIVAALFFSMVAKLARKACKLKRRKD